MDEIIIDTNGSIDLYTTPDTTEYSVVEYQEQIYEPDIPVAAFGSGSPEQSFIVSGDPDPNASTEQIIDEEKVEEVIVEEEEAVEEKEHEDEEKEVNVDENNIFFVDRSIDSLSDNIIVSSNNIMNTPIKEYTLSESFQLLTFVTIICCVLIYLIKKSVFNFSRG